jgi:hypothetical protein
MWKFGLVGIPHIDGMQGTYQKIKRAVGKVKERCSIKLSFESWTRRYLGG